MPSFHFFIYSINLIDFEKLDLNLSFYLTINYLQMEEEDAFVKYEYQIHIKDCAKLVIHKLKHSTLSPEMKISSFRLGHQQKNPDNKFLSAS